MEDSVSGKKYVYIQNDELLEFWENPGEGIVAMHSMIYIISGRVYRKAVCITLVTNRE